MAGGNCCGSELLHIQPPNGSPISSLRLAAGTNPSLPDPGSRWCIRRDIYPPRSIDRRSRPPDVSAFTLAKRIRRTVDRLGPQGMPRSYRGVRRTPSAPCAAVLHGLLQWHAHSLVVEQGRADIACRRGSGKHSVPSDPGWTASPICSGLICGRHSLFKFSDAIVIRSTLSKWLQYAATKTGQPNLVLAMISVLLAATIVFFLRGIFG